MPGFGLAYKPPADVGFFGRSQVMQIRLTNQSEKSWRSHIDGMRAISVLSVLLYHVGVSHFSGGFVGVDVFFVISGFLISKIIYDDLAACGRLRVAAFYDRRIRRILPVYVVVTAATIAAGYLLLLPDDFARLGQSAIYTTGFAANIFFYLSSDYFGPTANSQPLLHYWSLGVEEQFYIVFPIVMFACSRFAPRFQALSVVGIAIVSIGLAEFSIRTNPAAAFYLSPQRAWELMVGAMLALPDVAFPKRRILRETISMAGLGLILVSIFLYGPETKFPGLTATVPVVGAAAILLGCDRGPTLTGTVLSFSPLRLVGLWSYSIYMVHWPLIVYFRYFWPRINTTLSVVVVAASIALGALSYVAIETPFRRARGSLRRRRNLYIAASISLATLAGVASFIYASEGFASRLPAKVREILAYKNYGTIARSLWRQNQCFVGNSATWHDLDKVACLHPEHPSALLWGDSHAADLYPALSDLFKRHGIELSQANAAGCAPILDFEAPTHPNCRAFNIEAFDWIKTDRPDKVVLSAHWPLGQEYVAKTYRTIDELTSLGIFVIFIGETPTYIEPVPNILAKRLLRFDNNKLDEGSDNGRDQNSDSIFATHYADSTRVIYISPKRTFCENSACPLAGDDGLPLQLDQDHFTKRGAELAVSRMFGAPSTQMKIFHSFDGR